MAASDITKTHEESLFPLTYYFLAFCFLAITPSCFSPAFQFKDLDVEEETFSRVPNL